MMIYVEIWPNILQFEGTIDDEASEVDPTYVFI